MINNSKRNNIEVLKIKNINIFYLIFLTKLYIYNIIFKIFIYIYIYIYIYFIK